MSKASANVHRFQNRVAVSLPIGPTHYLRPKEARALIRALRSCAMDISKRSFVLSEFSSVMIPVADHDKQHLNED